MEVKDLVGTGYGRPKPTYDKEMVEVDAGTPMGEYFRRHWHPIAIAHEIKDAPKRVRLLCEDLIVFRDKRGRIGVVDEFCTHRQASLYYGRIEEEGIRCAYHGWMFDVHGRCVDQAVEAGGGKHRDKVRQPWYPVQEQYGLVFVYMGPPEHMPVLPKYDALENLGDDEELFVAWDSLPGSGGGVLPTNWLIDMDNMHDMGHTMWLHQLHSGPHFGAIYDFVTKENAADSTAAYKYIETPNGMYSEVEAPMPDGSIVYSTLETQLPLLRLLHPPFPSDSFGGVLNWCVPVDNTHHLALSLFRVKKGVEMLGNPMADWDRSDPEVVRQKPTDHEIQVSQGPIERHSLEHLAASDRGVIQMRRQYRRELQRMAAGEPLANVITDPAKAVLPVRATARLVKAAPEEVVVLEPVPSQAPGAMLEGAAVWQVEMSTPAGKDAVRLDLTIGGGSLTGSFVNSRETCAVTEGVASGGSLHWVSRITRPFSMKLTFKAAIDGDRISGTAKSMFGTARFEGRRVS